MRIDHAVALVTGANRGIGRAYVEALLTRGARRVYATARNTETLAPVVELDAPSESWAWRSTSPAPRT